MVAGAVLPWRPRLLVLLAASYVFYCWDVPYYGVIILASTVLDYVAGLAIAAAATPRRRRGWLIASVAANLGLLGYFKYANFLLDNMRPALEALGFMAAPVEVALPAGISFYTFQSLSYTIDVYRGRLQPTRDLPLFATYVAFFPQLVAGPIERAGRLLPQLAVKVLPTAAAAWEGFSLIVMGLAKKLVLADRLALLAAPAYAAPRAHDGWELLLAMFVMPISLYLDFGAYTDIARGSGKLVGVELSRNFDVPFAATSPTDYWSRWHMTLTSWVRDYLFRPLGGVRRHAPLRSAFNIVFSMTLVGLWHGAAWTFVLWGLAHGLFLALDVAARTWLRLPREPRTAAGAFAGWLATSALLFPTAPLFFCRDLATVAAFWRGLAQPWDSFGAPHLTLLAAFLVVLFAFQAAWRWWDLPARWARVPGPVQGALVALLVYVVLFGSVPAVQRFVYYQF